MSRVTKGNAAIDSNDGIQKMVDRVIRELAPTVAPILDRAAAELEAGAVAAWPVGRERGRPHSRDLFEEGLRFGGQDTIEAFVRNKADYAFFIKFKKRNLASGLGGKSASVELLRKPLKAIAPRVAKEVAEAAGDLIGGRK